ncbi:hypothetical protein ACLB2K_052348 [Fragaria x ananassa]
MSQEQEARQEGEEAIEGDQSLQPGGGRWTEEEVLQLCKSWKYVSQNPIVGKDRRKNNLWASVKQHYSINWSGHVRSTSAFVGRWKNLKVELYERHCALREAHNWKKSGSKVIDELEEAHRLWRLQIAKKLKPKKHIFSSFPCYEVVKGFSQFRDILSHTAPTGGTSKRGSQVMHTPPIVDNSPINLDIDGDEVIGGETLDPLVRPQGRKASKEARLS